MVCEEAYVFKCGSSSGMKLTFHPRLAQSSTRQLYVDTKCSYTTYKNDTDVIQIESDDDDNNDDSDSDVVPTHRTKRRKQERSHPCTYSLPLTSPSQVTD